MNIGRDNENCLVWSRVVVECRSYACWSLIAKADVECEEDVAREWHCVYLAHYGRGG